MIDLVDTDGCVSAQPMNMIDLFAIIPFYIEAAVGNGSQLQFLRVMRLTRVVRHAAFV